jgi:hypothetical protein
MDVKKKKKKAVKDFDPFPIMANHVPNAENSYGQVERIDHSGRGEFEQQREDLEHELRELCHLIRPQCVSKYTHTQIRERENTLQVFLENVFEDFKQLRLQRWNNRRVLRSHALWRSASMPRCGISL